jgi:hypothetical protein
MKIIRISQQEQQETRQRVSLTPPIQFPDFDTYNVEDKNVNVSIDRYPNSKFWAVNVNGQLLAVVVYRKGAMAIKSVIERLSKK